MEKVQVLGLVENFVPEVRKIKYQNVFNFVIVEIRNGNQKFLLFLSH